MTNNKVTVQDTSKLGYCLNALRPWFINHGLDWRDFVRSGVSISELEKIDDVLATNAIRAAEERIRGQ